MPQAMQWQQKNIMKGLRGRSNLSLNIFAIFSAAIGYGLLTSFFVSHHVFLNSSSNEDRWNGNFFTRSLQSGVSTTVPQSIRGSNTITSDSIVEVSQSSLLPVSEENDREIDDSESNEASSGNETLENGTRTRTDTGIDLTDASLYTGMVSSGDSSTATVMALATGYDLKTYQRFVGSLRKTGYKGHIILGIHPDPEEEIVLYLKHRNVVVKELHWINCTYSKSPEEKKDIFKKTTCADPYPDIKIRWSRFPLARDWLEECESCTGPVLVMDARDAVFQADPFGPGSPSIEGLQVFQEHVNMTTNNWLTEWPIRECKGMKYNEPMLCSGATVGTRAAMLKYLEIMYREMKVWIEEPKCRFDINGDDQSIHNYLFYSGQLPFAKSIPNRHGGIVNTIGHHASKIAQAHYAKLKQEKGYNYTKARTVPFSGANTKTWIGTEYGVTNENGMFTDFDGTVSRVVHQWDRFDLMLAKWIARQDWATDAVDIDALKSLEEKHQIQSPLLQIEASTNGTTLARTVTDTGLDLSDPELYASVDLQGDSSSATVIALATGYDMSTYERFVGGLRKTGYKGHIILGLAPDVPDTVLRYLEYRNVTAKILQWVNCTYTKSADDNKDIFKKTTCSYPYPDIKIRWSRFPLARDWLRDCETCTGPVLIMDARDSLFQLDPFGEGSPVIKGLQVFQEHVNMTTTNWLTRNPIGECKGVYYDEPMLCSGTTVGTRAAMLKYLEIMYEEMKVWIEDPKCRFNMNGDDQSIHNYLFYSGQLPFAESVVNRMGGIVNTIGHHAAQIAKAHFKKYADLEGLSKTEAAKRPYDGANGKMWIGTEFGVANEMGQFTEFDGSLSRVIHQYDRFHRPFDDWLRRTNYGSDPIPQDWKSIRDQ